MSGPTIYKVSEAVGPLGPTPVVKQSIDVRAVIIDFTRWLDTSQSEVIGTLSNFAIEADPDAAYPAWQTDIPFTSETSEAPADTTPLSLFGASVLSGNKKARILVANGTAGLTYMVSFLVTVSPSQRTKEIDLLVSINQAVNSEMITSTTPPTQDNTIVSATIALATGTAGSVYVENGTGSPITITLPASPTTGQVIDAKDVTGNAGDDDVTWQGASGALIDGGATYVWNQNFQATTFEWTGSQWSIR
jgi:hypothetical protein